MQRTDIELLAPSGSMEAFYGALTGGADAIYVGSAFFGARQSVGFDEEQLKALVSLAHLYGKRVHVTVNTLVKEHEIEALKQTLALLQELHVDAVLVQDLGVLLVCLNEFPSLPIHASTQMALHNKQGAEFLKSLSISRMVLARENDLEDLKSIKATGIETEIFAHGALCVSMSGQCLFSSMIGGRSGNRGRCAQPCRMQYTYKNQTKAWLSPADLMTRDILDNSLLEYTNSLKVEGRLKRPEYVYTITKAYDDALKDYFDHTFVPLDTVQKEALIQIFSRGGFTKGYMDNAQDKDVMYPDSVTPLGLLMGEVFYAYKKGDIYLADMYLTRDLHNLDGLKVDNQSVIYSGLDVKKGEIATLRLRFMPKPKTKVYRTEDENQLKHAQQFCTLDSVYKTKRIPFDAHFEAKENQEVRLCLTAKGVTVTKFHPPLNRADNAPLTIDSVQKVLSKTGGTPFVLSGLKADIGHVYFPLGMFNALRREALQALHQALILAHEQHTKKRQSLHILPSDPQHTKRRLMVKSTDLSFLSYALQNGADFAVYQPLSYKKERILEDVKNMPANTALLFPVFCKSDENEMLKDIINAHHLPVMLSNVGQLSMHFTVPVYTDYAVPVYNSNAENMLAYKNVKGCTLSPELTLSEIAQLQAPVMERIQVVYGRIRLMTLSHCIERTQRGLCTGHATCNLCKDTPLVHGQTLTDKMGFEFPLMPIKQQTGCKTYLYHAQPLDLLQSLHTLEALPLSFMLDFTFETLEQSKEVLLAYKNALKEESFSSISDILNAHTTEGRSKKGVL